jgi:phosphatidyl-myo-inositol dimannoside synthase
MNILIIASNFKPLIGGVAEYTHQLASGLFLRGHRIIVFSPHSPGDKEFDATCSYKVSRYDAQALYALPKLKRNWKEYKIIKQMIKTEGIEIVIGDHLCAEPYLYWLAAKTTARPTCVFIHGLDILSGLNGIDGFKKRLVLSNVKRIFCNSRFTRDAVISFGFPSAKTSIVYPGINISDFKAGNNKTDSPVTKKLSLEGKKVIFTLGRLIERKGQDTLIKAMPLILKEVLEAVCLIGGEGPYEEQLKLLAQEQGVKEKVIFVGRVREVRRQDYYDACDVFAMPARQLESKEAEAFGIVYLEANACAKPVIGGRSGGAVEVIIENQTGLLVDPGDPDEVAGAIIKLLKDPALAKDMGLRGRQMVEDKFSWEKLLPGIEAGLKELIS